MSIRLRLTLWYSGLFAVVFVAFGLIVYNSVHQSTMSDLKDRLQNVASEVVLSRRGFEYNLNSSSDYFNKATVGMQLVNYANSKDGTVAGKSNNLIGSSIEFPFPDYEKAAERFVKENVGPYPFLVYEKPITAEGQSGTIGLLQVGVLADGEFKLLQHLKKILWFSGGASLLAAFGLGMFLSRKALRPIGRVTEFAERIRSGSELSLRIPREPANDEIGRLTDTLNGMLNGLERAYNNLEDSNTAQRRFVSDASHELRTPLTTIRGNIDLLEKIWTQSGASEETGRALTALSESDKQTMSREAIHDIADEARRMSGLVGDLLSLARADAGYAMELEVLSPGSLVEEAARRAAFLPRKADWAVGPLHALEGVEVRGNRDYLLQLLFILIENGFKYTPSGEVRLYASQSGEFVGLTVADTGIGMSPEEIPHIFERFYRADVSRGQTAGTGLGLSIAKWIADAHHARIETKSRPGVGSAFTLWLPIVRL